ncbi:hypothetical protein AB0H83_45830 [Dactylosporangium sp. NPDC050688]|uniref:hypothetical protein n=1 Tax=Dactylosporangium sp. NPDC050688 TaxID=3157217 RepID=UPI0033E0690E
MTATPAMLPGAEQWCQTSRSGHRSWRRTSEGGFDPARYIVAPLRTAPVARFIEQHHYSRSRASTVLGYVLVDLWPDRDPDATWLDLEPLRTASLPTPARSHRRGQIVGALTLGNPMNQHTLPSVFPRLTPYRQALEANRLVLLDRVPSNAEVVVLRPRVPDGRPARHPRRARLQRPRRPSPHPADR